jgi:delta1-piperideine-2-carboxylate reductase
VRGIFESHGLAPHAAAAMARVIAAAERDNCKSHGLHRVEQCLQVLKAGKVSPDAVPVLDDAPGPILRVDAGGGFHPPAWEAGRSALIARTRELGLAALVVNDCLHFSALWYEVEDLAREGLAALSMCPSYATVAPSGGRLALLGTNPFAFGWPRRNGDPYVFDFATSVAARGEVELHRRAGDPLPEGWAIDRDGEPTTDPAAALDGALLPFGGHKGSAIATMIELMAGAMIGDRMSKEALDFMGSHALLPRHGALILCFDPGVMSRGRGRDPVEEGEMLIAAIAAQTSRIPSQRRYTARARTAEAGIALTAGEIATLERLATGGVEAVSPS